MIHNVLQIKSRRKPKQDLVGSPRGGGSWHRFWTHITIDCIVNGTFSFSGFRRRLAGSEALKPAFFNSQIWDTCMKWTTAPRGSGNSLFQSPHRLPWDRAALCPRALPSSCTCCCFTSSWTAERTQEYPLGSKSAYVPWRSPCGQNPPEPQSKTNGLTSIFEKSLIRHNRRRRHNQNCHV